MVLKEISVADLKISPVTLISDEWMLVTCGTLTEGFNTMTASWGHLGEIWGRDTAICYIRPHRYTKEFADKNGFFTLSFFPPENKQSLVYLGTHSGRDENKVEHSHLTPVGDERFVWFDEAKLVLFCRKLYAARIVPEGFCDKSLIEENYPSHDFHTMYIGEIDKVLSV